jgi:hypothetical protein
LITEAAKRVNLVKPGDMDLNATSEAEERHICNV